MDLLIAQDKEKEYDAKMMQSISESLKKVIASQDSDIESANPHFEAFTESQYGTAVLIFVKEFLSQNNLMHTASMLKVEADLQRLEKASPDAVAVIDSIKRSTLIDNEKNSLEQIVEWNKSKEMESTNSSTAIPGELSKFLNMMLSKKNNNESQIP